MIKIFKDWGMSTTQGNERLTKLAQDYIDNLGDLSQITIEQFKTASTNYVKSWKKLWNTKTYPESSNTAVRELILNFVEKIGQELTVPSYININILIRQVLEHAYWSD